MEEILIKTIEKKVEELEKTRLEKIEQMKKEQKLDVAYAKLTKYKEDAEKEIENDGEASKEAKLDLEKIEAELEKVRIAELDIIEKVENEISTVKNDLEEANKIIEKEENAQKENDNIDKEIKKLLKYREEALTEISNKGEGSKEASIDLGKIEAELKDKQTIKEQNEKVIKQTNESKNALIEKYGVKEILELNAAWDEAIKENEEFDKRKFLQDWDEAIEENKKFDEQYNGNLNSDTSVKPKPIIKANLDSRSSRLSSSPSLSQNLSQNLKDEKIKNITILESKEQLLYEDENGEIITLSLREIDNEKRAMFKRLEIGKMCKKNTISVLDYIMLYRKVNPAVVKALNNDKDQIEQYIKDLRNKNEFGFNLTHDISGLSIFKKLTKNRFVKAEEKCGASILGKIFNKNKTLGESKEDKEDKTIKTSSQAHKDFEKTYKLVAQDREYRKLENDVSENLSKQVTKMMSANRNDEDGYSELVNKDYMQSLEEKFRNELNETQNSKDIEDER